MIIKKIVSISSVILIIFFSLSISAENNFTSFETLKEQAENYYQEGSYILSYETYEKTRTNRIETKYEIKHFII